MKAWNKSGRKFLNTEASGCTDTVYWSVTFVPAQPDSKHRWNRKASMDAEFRVTENACSLYVTRKGELKPLHNLRSEMEKFEAYCSDAFANVEKANGETD